MEKKKHSYITAVLLNVLLTLIPIGGITYFIWNISANGLDDTTTSGIVLTASLLIYAFLRIPLKKYLSAAILDNEYDEFGVSKKKKFENLTRAEREEMDMMKAADMERLLSSSAMKQLIRKGSAEPEKDLESLIGLKTVKTKVSEMAARMRFDRERRNNKDTGLFGRHFCFYGNPGTGKTTVARILAGFLYQNGFIKENKCVEIDGNFLKAGSDSAAKTRLVIRKAYGGVLFIDEAYAIVDGTGEYGKEVIATLIKEMEDNRDRFTLILAGYKNDMERLVSANEGFKSRIKEYISFPDYNDIEMREIFASMANKEGFAVSGEAFDNYDVRIAKERKLSTFGNGRTARQILDESIDRHAVNYERTKENKFLLTADDISTETNKDKL